MGMWLWRWLLVGSNNSEDPWATLGRATSWSQHRGHTAVGHRRTRDDGLRGAMCCVSLGWKGWRILLGAQSMACRRRGVPLAGEAGAAACLASRDGRFTGLGCILRAYLQREASGYRAIWGWGPAVQWPAAAWWHRLGSGRDTAQPILCGPGGRKGEGMLSCRRLARTAGLGVGTVSSVRRVPYSGCCLSGFCFFVFETAPSKPADQRPKRTAGSIGIPHPHPSLLHAARVCVRVSKRQRRRRPDLPMQRRQTVRVKILKGETKQTPHPARSRDRNHRTAVVRADCRTALACTSTPGFGSRWMRRWHSGTLALFKLESPGSPEAVDGTVAGPIGIACFRGKPGPAGVHGRKSSGQPRRQLCLGSPCCPDWTARSVPGGLAWRSDRSWPALTGRKMGRPAARHQLPRGVHLCASDILTVMLFFTVEAFYILHVFSSSCRQSDNLEAGMLMFAGFSVQHVACRLKITLTLAEAWNLQAAACPEAGTNMLSARRRTCGRRGDLTDAVAACCPWPQIPRK